MMIRMMIRMIIKMIGMMMSVRKKMEAGGVLCAASSVSPTRDDASCPARKPVTVKKVTVTRKPVTV